MEGQDPAAEIVARRDVHDVRPCGDAPADASGFVVVSGPDDMRELRLVVEQSLGVGTWPTPRGGPGERLTATLAVERLTATLAVERPATLLGVLIAMEGLIEIRSPWRTWRTAVESLGPAVAGLDTLSLDARVIDLAG